MFKIIQSIPYFSKGYSSSQKYEADIDVILEDYQDTENNFSTMGVNDCKIILKYQKWIESAKRLWCGFLTNSITSELRKFVYSELK